MPEHAPEVLFVCVHNARRSQMAAALLARYGGERVVVGPVVRRLPTPSTRRWLRS